ncbi:ribonuclease H-like domain-containing protein [Xylaria bambusicola]|uniref:ribonuclease H-like domain-containing protein n=1 Tax=Xylaria bambusicola TaxID=326684 RepID=UPI002007F431|nr:ribonuclease H-like domain-containing protein [Xylaria bambusicola]KAI0502775.1 ribonuclease H-like domain-containing protein [Xylaria bambusicola]
MSAYCAPCNRSFKDQSGLDQHLRKSSSHKPSSTQRLPLAIPSGSNTPHVKTPAIQKTPKGAKSPWSRITTSEYTTALDELSAHCHSTKELEEHDYIVRPYDPEDYVNAKICKQCHGKQIRIVRQECTFHPSKRNKWNKKKPYKCCDTITGGGGCRTLPTHDFDLPRHALRHQDFRQTPGASTQPKSRAVALDCEMAGIGGGASEVILLCATDFLTGAVLVNRLVCPNERITDMRTSIHGITKASLDEATAQGKALSAWEGARSELWKHIDDRTILVGHALEHDLGALRMIHPRVVDSSILSEIMVGGHRVRFGLQKLSSELPKIQIRKGKDGIHDCMEDVLATRELVLFCTRARNKTAFRAWAEAKTLDQIRREAERRAKKEEKANKRHRMRARGGSSSYAIESDDEEEVLHWSDIAEDFGWPHPDTGYDPWSD